MARCERWKAEQWPNGQGFDVTAPNGRKFEVWPAGSVVELEDDADSFSGTRGLRYCETGIRGIVEGNDAISLVCETLLLLNWKPCYDIAPVTC